MQDNDIFQYFNHLGVQSINIEGLEVQLILMNKDFEVYRANTQQTMSPDLIRSFLEPVWRLVTTGPDRGLQVLSYDPQNKPDHEVIWKLNVDEVPAFQVIQEQLERPFDELATYEDEEGDLEGITSIALRVQATHGDIVIFQRIMPNYILKNSRKLTMIFTGASFGRLEEPAAFQISRDNHVVYIGEKLYVLNQTHFEYLFDYQDKKTSIADTKLEEIAAKYAANIILPEGKTLGQILNGDKTAINKLQKLDPTAIIDREHLTDLHLHFDSPVKIDADTGKMVIEDKADAKELINILNDDYLGSSVTSERYSVNSKKKIIKKAS